MRLLKIKDNQGQYYVGPNNYLTLDKLTKEGLLMLVNLTLENEIEMDEYNEETLKHQAHQVIYKNVFQKLNELDKRKQEFTDDSETLFLEDYEKYKG